jgi:hypothetical protein
MKKKLIVMNIHTYKMSDKYNKKRAARPRSSPLVQGPGKGPTASPKIIKINALLDAIILVEFQEYKTKQTGQVVPDTHGAK